MQRHSQNRYSIFIDNEFAFGLSKDVVLDSALGRGDQLSIAQIESLLDREQTATAIDIALRALAQRPQSERELRNRLRSRKIDPTIVDKAIARLIELKYVDDQDFSRVWVENRRTHRPRSKRLIQQELMQKGIDRATIEATIQDNPIDEIAAARELAQKRARSYSQLTRNDQRTKLTSFLARKGFDYPTIRTVLDELLAAADGDEMTP